VRQVHHLGLRPLVVHQVLVREQALGVKQGKKYKWLFLKKDLLNVS
jgi:hypothetical protein